MIICYVLSLVSFFMLNIAFFQSFLRFTVFHANYVTFILMTSIVYLFTETLVIFFFVGAGMSIKDLALENKIYAPFHQRSRDLKHKVFPILVLNLFLMMTVFILVGAVDTARLPVWAYNIIFLGCLIHFVKTKIIQNQGFQENSQIYIDISKVEIVNK